MWLLWLLAFALVPGQKTQASLHGVVISQVYGGGGNPNASYTHDFVELFNRGANTVSLNGWSLQYAQTSQSTWQSLNLPDATLQPGQYYLVQYMGGAVGAALPTPDLTTAIGIVNSAGRVALVRTTTLLAGTDPDRTHIEDLLGYGNTTAYEGNGPAPTMSDNLTALARRNAGCTDTNDNQADFVTLSPPTPRNSSSPLAPCNGENGEQTPTQTPTESPPTDTPTPEPDNSPKIIDVSPADQALNIPVDANIALSFDVPVTVGAGAFSLSCTKSGALSLGISGGPQNYLISPAAHFINGESCTMTVFAAHITNQQSPPIPMSADYTWGFMIVDAPPQVLSVSPADGAAEVPLNSTLSVTFSEAVSFPSSAFTLNCSASGSVSAGLSGGPQVFIIAPVNALVHGESCTVTLLAAQISDQDGISSLNMPNDFSWGFSTVPADVVDSAPSVTSTSPPNGAAEIPLSSVISLSFSEDVVTSGQWYDITCTLSGGISAVVTGGPRHFTLTPEAPFLPDETCIVRIYAAGVRDLDGIMQTMNADYLWSFVTVGAGAADVPPQVNPGALSPADGAIGVGVNAPITVSFSEDVSVSGQWFSIVCTVSGTVNATVTGGPRVYMLTPQAALAHDETCMVTIFGAQVQDTDDPPKPLGADFSWQFTTVPDASVCGQPFTPIYALRAQGAASTLTTEGFVTGDFEGSVPQTLGGFYMQAPSPGDDDPATSDGIFVWHPGVDAVSVGDYVRVIGTLEDSSGQTRISNPAVIQCPAVGEVLPTMLNLPFADAADLERYEGMWVVFPQTLSLTDSAQLGRLGVLGVSANGRLFAPTQINPPGQAAITQQAVNTRNTLRIQAPSAAQYPDPTPFLPQEGTLRLGDTLTGLTGILSLAAGEYRLYPTTAPAFQPANPRPAPPVLAGGTLRVASMNLGHYLNGPGFPTANGAETPQDFARQREKLSAALLALDADIIGLNEIENDGYGPGSAIQDLVNGLNASAGAGTYALIDPGFRLGEDDISVGLIYRPAALRPVGEAKSTTQAPFGQGRPPLAQTFEQISTGERLTVVVTHFKARECSGAMGLNADQGDGQGCWNAERSQAAHALIDWLHLDPTKSFDPDFLILGDLNAYALEDPLTVFRNASYSDLIGQFVGGATYNDVFQGQAGTLNYALASPALAAQVKGAALWHINADEPAVLGYELKNKSAAQQALNTGTPFRSADRDPILISLSLTSAFGTELTWHAPLGLIETSYGNPIYEWSRVQAATEYQLYIAPALNLTQPLFHEVMAAAEVCAGVLCRVDLTTLDEAYRLVNGAYMVYARPWQGSTPGVWMGPFGFVLNAPPPQVVTLIPPDDLSTSRPAYTWILEGGAANASWFRVYLAARGELSTPLFDEWLPRESACGGVEGLECAITLPVDLVNGAYALYVGGWGPGGFSIGGISGFAGLNFDISAPPPAMPAGLTATLNQGRPVFSWEDAPHAAWYRLMIAPPGGGTPIYEQWHLKADLACADGLCTWKPDTNPTNGAYQATLMAWGPGGFSPVSAPVLFDLDFTAPGQVMGMTVTGAAGGLPSFVWQAVPGVTWYQMWVGTPQFETNYLAWHLAADLDCENGGICTLAAPVELLNGAYGWYLRSWGPGDFSTGGLEGWTQGPLFTVNAPAAPIPAPLMPDGLTNKVRPLFIWAHVPGLRWYEVRVEAITGPDPDPAQSVYQGWHSAAALGCLDAGLCALQVAGLELPLGDYLWGLRAYSPAGLSEWSSYRAFKVLR